jgi:hypothetical protein
MMPLQSLLTIQLADQISADKTRLRASKRSADGPAGIGKPNLGKKNPVLGIFNFLAL